MLTRAPDTNAHAAEYKLVRETPLAEFDTKVPRRKINASDENKVEKVIEVVEARLKDMVSAKKRFLFGVTFVEMAAEALFEIAVARRLASPHVLLEDLIFAVFVGYTVSRDWAIYYNTLPASSLLRKFEIDGRVSERNDPAFAKNSWINSCKMNATACHLLAYLVVETAGEGGTLSRLKKEKGTPFTDKALQTEQGKIITELAKTISDQDRDALAKFKDEFGIIVKAVDLLFGLSGLSLDEALAKAKKMKPAEF